MGMATHAWKTSIWGAEAGRWKGVNASLGYTGTAYCKTK